MKEGIFKRQLLALLTIGLLTMTGCGGSSDSTPAATTDGTTAATYEGDSTVSGTIDLSSLSGSDQSAVNQAVARSRYRDSRSDGDEIVKLYVITEDGSEKDTNITCTVTDGAYECPNVKDGQDYITRYLKDEGGGKILELKATVVVPEGATTVTKVMDPITTVLVAAVVDAVKNAVIGLTSDTALIESIIASVTNAITETMKTIMSSPTYVMPSMIVDGNFTAIEEETETEAIVNTNLSEVVGVVNSDESVTNVVTAVKKEAEGDAFGAASNDDKMIAVFKTLGWDKDLPGWVLELFSGEFDNVNYINPETNATEAMTFRKFFAGNNLTVNNNGADDHNPLANMGLTPEQVSSIATSVATAINLKMNSGDMFTAMITDVERYHTIAAKAVRTNTEIEFMAHFDPTIAQVFPDSFIGAAGFDFDTEIQNMAQLMLILGYLDPRDGGLTDIIIESVKNELPADLEYYESQLRFVGETLFSDDKGSLLESMFTKATMAQYDSISIGWIEAQQQDWHDGTTAGTSTSMLSVRTNLESLAWDEGIDADDLALIEGNVTYPTSAGDVTVALAYLQDPYSSTENPRYYFGVEAITCTNPQDHTTCSASENPITDFVTGEYTVAFSYDGEVFSKSQDFYFLQDAQQYSATFTNPKSAPQWDPSWDTYMDYQNGGVIENTPEAIATAIEELNDFWQNGPKTFTPNSITGEGDVNNTLSDLTISWDAPDVSALELPENIVVAYNLDVRLYEPQDTNGDDTIDWDDCNYVPGDNNPWEECNKQIYNTWDDDRLITSTSMTLPVDLKENAVAEVGQQQGQYDISITVQFIDKETRQQVAHGGWNNAQFRVGQIDESRILTGDEFITVMGEVKVNEWEWFDEGTQEKVTETSTIPTNFKVAVISESWRNTGTQDDNGWDIWENNVSTIKLADYNSTNKTYSVSATWSELEELIGNNSNIQIIGFDDTSGDDKYQPRDWNTIPEEGSQPVGEDSYWINGGFWIETHGDKTIHVDRWNDEGDYSNDSYNIRKDKNVTIEGLDIKIW